MNIGIIPARYASTRFPGKPLAMIYDKPMIQHVFERAKESSLDQVIVATDDLRIEEAVKQFGGNVMLSSPNHPSGTDRCGEIASKLQLKENDVVINIQGDEPFIQKQEINTLLQLFDNECVEIATLVKPIDRPEEIEDPNKVKVVVSKQNRALYFSRYPIPYIRGDEKNVFYKHIGIYAYRYKTLQKIIQLPTSKLENCEKLEQLRWLENDFSIYTALCYHESVAIDTPEDLLKIPYLY